MPFQSFGKRKIFRPRWQVLASLGTQAKEALLSRFQPGTYSGGDNANPIIHHLFSLYDQKLRALVPLIASRDVIDFLLFQYDEACKLLHGKGISDANERSEWARIEGNFKKSIKYTIELLCMEQRQGQASLTSEELILATELAFTCAEMAVYLAEMSNRIHLMFPNNCLVTIHQDSTTEIFSIEVTGKYSGFDARYQRRLILDRQNRERFIDPLTQFDVHTMSHVGLLDPAFSDSFGMSYSLFLAGLRAIIEGARPSGAGHLPTLFIRRSKLLTQLKDSSRPTAAIESMLDGFTVTSTKLIEEKRVVWNPKQNSRALRRGFFKLLHESGEHLGFSRAMAKESMIHLVSGVCFQKMPPEWMTPRIKKALASLSNEAGKWFEKQVAFNLRTAGYHGRQFKALIRSERGQLRIPAEIGELDFLGYHPDQKKLLLVEAKFTLTGLEARSWNDDILQFISGSKPFADRFRKKKKWVGENFAMILRILDAPDESVLDARILTLYPCIAAEFIDDFPCQSLTEFMMDAGESADSPTAFNPGLL